jgi:hypothetical protein
MDRKCDSDWLPPADHPAGRRFREIQLRWIGPEYAEQKQLLDAIHARTGDEMLVASFSAVSRNANRSVVNYCVWGDLAG